MSETEALSLCEPIGNFTLKVDIQAPLTLDVLIAELEGVNGLLEPLSAFASKINGRQIKFQSVSIGRIEEGSILIDGVGYILATSNGLDGSLETIKYLKSMDWPEIMKILTILAMGYAGKKLVDYITPSKNDKEGKTINLQTRGDNSPIIIGREVAEEMKLQFSGKDEIIDQATKSIVEVDQEEPQKIYQLQKATNMISQPSGVRARSVNVIENKSEDSEGTSYTVLSETTIKQFPEKYVMPKIEEVEKKKRVDDVLLKLVCMHIDSKAQNAWKVRIEEDGYTKKDLPFDVDNEEDRERILTLAPHPFLADIELIYTCKEGEDPVYKKCIIKKLTE